MAYNILSGTVLAADYYMPRHDVVVANVVSGNLSTSNGASVINVPRVSNATNNSLITNVGGDANTLVCESNLTFDGSLLNVTGDLTASIGVSASFFEGDGSRLTGITAGGISWDGSTANGVATYKDSSTATVESNLTFDGSTLTVTGDSTIDKNHSDTDAATVTGLEIDFDKTGASTSNNTMYGVKLDMDNTTATNGTNYMYGIYATPTLTHAADAGASFVYGALINAQGGTNGSTFVQGARIEAGGGDINYGIQLDVEDGGVDLRIESSADNGDYFQIQTTTHGATTITTQDDNATAAHLTFDVDGDITLDPAGGDIHVVGNISASIGLSASFFEGDGSRLTGIASAALDVEQYGSAPLGTTISSSAGLALIKSGSTTGVGGAMYTLPAASSGKTLHVKLSASVANVTLEASTGDRIEGGSLGGSIILESTGSGVTLIAFNASDWWIL